MNITQRFIMFLLILISIIIFINTGLINSEICNCSSECKKTSIIRKCNNGLSILGSILFTFAISYFLLTTREIQKSYINYNIFAIIILMLGIIIITLNSIIINISSNLNCSKILKTSIVNLVVGILTCFISFSLIYIKQSKL